MSILPLIFLFCSNHDDVLPFRYFDLCELNHKYNSYDDVNTDGRIVFDQLIVYNWDRDMKHLVVQGFSMVRTRQTLTPEEVIAEQKKFARQNPGQPIPIPNGKFEYKGLPRKKDGFYELIFTPIGQSIPVKIRCLTYVETHTAHDPDVVHAREILPKEKRVSWPKKVIKMPSKPAFFIDPNPIIMTNIR